MEIFWVVLGVVIVAIYVINQNKTKTTDKTIIRQRDTYKTETGEITIERTKVVDTSQVTFSVPQTVQVSPAEVHNQALVNGRAQQAIVNEKQLNAVKEVTKVDHRLINPAPRVDSIPTEEKVKQCTRCRVHLPFSKFSKSSKHPDGVTIWCTACLKGDKNTKHMKWCPKCKIRRKRTSFYSNSQNADGLMAWCKTCWNSHKKNT